MTNRSRHDEQGSALIMALLVLLFVAIVTTAALSYAGTSASTTAKAITPSRTARYDADSAIQAALQYVKRDQSIGGSLGKDTGLPCPPSPGADPRATFVYPGTSGPVSVNICPQIDSFNLDGNARAVLLTLAGPGSGEGIDFAKNVDDTINGDVWSNSYFALGSSASVAVNGGKLWSWNPNSCSGSITAPVGKDCNAGATFGFTTLGGALNNSQSTLTVAANAKFPASGQYVIAIDNEQMLVTAGQGTNSWTVTRGYGGTTAAAHANNTRVSFVPKTGLDPADPLLGHVADWQPAAAPGAIQVPSGCTFSPGVYLSGNLLSTRTSACNGGVTLLPGVYYLNFPTGDDTWTISNDVTGACDGTGQGAQLVFANASRLAMSGSSQRLTLCGRRVSPTAPQIAMTYLKTSTSSGPDTNVILRPSANPTPTGTLTWTNLPNVVYSGSAGYPQDGTNATATASGSKAGNISIGSLSAPVGQSIPANAVVTSVKVRVGHDETSGWTFPSSGVNQPSIQWGSCSTALAPAPTIHASSSAYVSNELASNFISCAGFDPSQTPMVTWGLSNAAGSSTAHVDGAQVEVTWHSPGVTAQQGCVTQLMSAGGCELLSGPANGQDSMNITGVVYLPHNRFAGVFKNGGSLVISEALIARSVDLEANPASVGAPIIGGPTNQFVIGKVLFQAFIGSTDWTDAYATFDKTTFVPTINSWVVKR